MLAVIFGVNGVAAVAQLVNCLQSPFLAHDDKFCVTPTYHVFDMYSAHQGAQGVRVVCESPAVNYTRNGKPATLPGLSGSASLDGKRLILTVANPSLDQPRETKVALRGGSVKAIKAVTLATKDPHAHNSFESPRAVEPKEQSIASQESPIVHTFLPASVTKLEIQLG